MEQTKKEFNRNKNDDKNDTDGVHCDKFIPNESRQSESIPKASFSHQKCQISWSDNNNN